MRLIVAAPLQRADVRSSHGFDYSRFDSIVDSADGASPPSSFLGDEEIDTVLRGIMHTEGEANPGELYG